MQWSHSNPKGKGAGNPREVNCCMAGVEQKVFCSGDFPGVYAEAKAHKTKPQTDHNRTTTPKTILRSPECFRQFGELTEEPLHYVSL